MLTTMNQLHRALVRPAKRVVSPQLLPSLPFSTRASRPSSSDRSRLKPLPSSPPPLQAPPELTAIISQTPPELTAVISQTPSTPAAEDVPVKKFEMVFNRPRPGQIPFQEKVANTVNLIGAVRSPIKFRTSPDGKLWAGTLISHQQFSDSSPLRIPIVFEGELAHAAACHVKENDNIYVAGELSADPLPLELDNNGLANLQVMVHSVNFVDGIPELKARSEHRKQEQSSGEPALESDVSPQDNDTGSERKVTKSSSHTWDYWNELVKDPKQWCDYRNDKLNGTVNPKHPDFKKVDSSQPLWLSSAPKWIVPKLEGLEFSPPAPKQKKEYGGFSSPVQKKAYGGFGSTTPKQNEGWGQFSTLLYKTTEVEGFKEDSGKPGNESWKDLLENPDKWWDNRVGKKYEKAPDFKNKVTGAGLWLNSAPEWVLTKLPEPKSRRLSW